MNEEEVQAVKASAEKFYAALNSLFTGELEPMKAVWSHADDVTYMGPAGGVRVGWEQVLADWQAQAALNLGGQVHPEDMHITVGKDLATISNYVKGENVDPQGKPVPVSLRATTVHRKEAGEWKVIGIHTDLLPFLQK